MREETTVTYAKQCGILMQEGPSNEQRLRRNNRHTNAMINHGNRSSSITRNDGRGGISARKGGKVDEQYNCMVRDIGGGSVDQGEVTIQYKGSASGAICRLTTAADSVTLKNHTVTKEY